jgi:hypothetical protein
MRPHLLKHDLSGALGRRRGVYVLVTIFRRVSIDK